MSTFSNLLLVYTIQYIMYIDHSLLYIVHYTLYIIHCTLYLLHCIMYIVHHTMHIMYVYYIIFISIHCTFCTYFTPFTTHQPPTLHTSITHHPFGFNCTPIHPPFSPLPISTSLSAIYSEIASPVINSTHLLYHFFIRLIIVRKYYYNYHQ